MTAKTAKAKAKTPPVKLKKPAIITVAPPAVKVNAAASKTKVDRVAKTEAVTQVKTGKAVRVEKASTQQQLKDAYSANVLKLTYLKLKYPKKALQRMERGKVALKVKLNRNGNVIKVTEAISSRYTRLNKAARLAVKKTAPYPKPPKELRGDSFEFTLPFNFKL